MAVAEARMRRVDGAATADASAALHKRRTNAWIRESLDEADAADPGAFLCECRESGCFRTLWLLRREYDERRAIPAWNALASGHRRADSGAEPHRAPSPLRNRRRTMNDVLITHDGLAKLKAELKRLHAERVELLKLSLESGGGFPENGGLLDARHEQELLGWRIARLEQRLSAARLVEPEPDGELDIGERACVRDLASGDVLDYRIVGTGQGDPARGDISHDSPVGSALLGARTGDVVEVDVPNGRRLLELVEVHG